MDVHQVEDFGSLAEKIEQLAAGNAGAFFQLVVREQFRQVLVRKLRDNYQLALDDLDAIDGKQEGMADGLDMLDGAELFLGAGAVGFETIEVAVDELDGFEDAAGGFAFPDFTEAAAPERFQKLIPRKGFRLRLSEGCHCSSWRWIDGGGDG